ncbi:MAG TPA: hypothetical protein VK923_11575, partial [Euzebyales bacterium]|nr:hypothetical protein [Euzebyales bacterium]
RGSVEVSADLAYHAAWLHDVIALGFDGVWIHHVGQQQRPFLEAFGEHVLPQVRTGGTQGAHGGPGATT